MRCAAPRAAPRPFSISVPQRMPRALPRSAAPMHAQPRSNPIPITVRRLYSQSEHPQGSPSAPPPPPSSRAQPNQHGAANHKAHASAPREKADDAKPAPANEAPASTALQEEVTKLKSEVTKLKETLSTRDADLEQMKTNLMYAVAEKENIKRLTKTEADNARTFGIQRFAGDLLEVADTLKLALKSVSAADLAATQGPMKKMYEGVELTWKAMQKAFGTHGLKEIDPKGQKFDPQVAQAVFQVPPSEGKPAGTVHEVIKSAYTLNDRLIRAALVGVVQGTYVPTGEKKANNNNGHDSSSSNGSK